MIKCLKTWMQYLCAANTKLPNSELGFNHHLRIHGRNSSFPPRLLLTCVISWQSPDLSHALLLQLVKKQGKARGNEKTEATLTHFSMTAASFLNPVQQKLSLSHIENNHIFKGRSVFTITCTSEVTYNGRVHCVFKCLSWFYPVFTM